MIKVISACDINFSLKFQCSDVNRFKKKCAYVFWFCRRIEQAVARLLQGFLEGVVDDTMPNQMLALLNWDGVVDQVFFVWIFGR